MKKLFILLLFSTISVPIPAATVPSPEESKSSSKQTTHQTSTIRPEKRNDSAFVLFDVFVYRPIGLAATIVGAALFVGLSPLTALASIAPPHDAFAKTADILIVAPGEYTFTRPVGARSLAY